ncbi:MAG: hypothetical protein ACJATT_002721 [Myxococcota bacterium]
MTECCGACRTTGGGDGGTNIGGRSAVRSRPIARAMTATSRRSEADRGWLTRTLRGELPHAHRSLHCRPSSVICTTAALDATQSTSATLAASSQSDNDAPAGSDTGTPAAATGATSKVRMLTMVARDGSSQSGERRASGGTVCSIRRLDRFTTIV